MGREIPCSSEEQGEGEGEGSGETEENRERDTYLHQTSLYKCYLVHIRPPLATIYLDFTSWSYLSTTPKPIYFYHYMTLYSYLIFRPVESVFGV